MRGGRGVKETLRTISGREEMMSGRGGVGIFCLIAIIVCSTMQSSNGKSIPIELVQLQMSKEGDRSTVQKQQLVQTLDSRSWLRRVEDHLRPSHLNPLTKAVQRAEGDLVDAADTWLMPKVAFPLAPQLTVSTSDHARGSKGTSEPVIEYMPGSITTNKEAQEVGYIFLPEEGGSLVATDTQHESSSKTQLAAPPPIPGQVATPKYERKFAPWLPCSVWGGDQVVCTDKLGKTTITVVMDDGTVKPPGGQSSGTWEVPGAHHLQPEEAKGECYSSCDFYWAYTVTHAIYF